MTGERLDAVIKARVASEQKRAIQEIAKARQLKEADILREIIRRYLEPFGAAQPVNGGDAP
jgi:hypothetical protein